MHAFNTLDELKVVFEKLKDLRGWQSEPGNQGSSISNADCQKRYLLWKKLRKKLQNVSDAKMHQVLVRCRIETIVYVFRAYTTQKDALLAFRLRKKLRLLCDILLTVFVLLLIALWFT